jgi:WD40 repeat protein
MTQRTPPIIGKPRLLLCVFLAAALTCVWAAGRAGRGRVDYVPAGVTTTRPAGLSRESRDMQDDKPLWTLALSPDGSRIVSGGDAGAALWDVRALRITHRLIVRGRGVRAIAFSRDGTAVAVGMRDGAIHLFSAHDANPRGTLRGHASWVTGLAFIAPDRLASCAHDGTLRIWDTAAHREVRRMRVSPLGASALAFCPLRGLLALATHGAIRLIDAGSGVDVGTLVFHEGWVLSVDFSPDGQRLVSGGYDTRAAVWDIESRRVVTRFAGHHAAVQAVRFMPDGMGVVSSGDDNQICIWDADGGALRRQGDARAWTVTALAPARDGRGVFLAALSGHVQAWRLTSP